MYIYVFKMFKCTSLKGKKKYCLETYYPILWEDGALKSPFPTPPRGSPFVHPFPLVVTCCLFFFQYCLSVHLWKKLKACDFLRISICNLRVLWKCYVCMETLYYEFAFSLILRSYLFCIYSLNF